MITVISDPDLTTMLVPERHKMRRILVIENDPEVSSFLVDSFNEDTVEIAHTISEGIARISNGGGLRPKIDAVILDPDLPCCKGLECYKCLRAAAPSIPVVVMSGSEDVGLAKATAGDGVEYILRDASLPSTLQTMLRTSIERFHIVQEARELRAKG